MLRIEPLPNGRVKLVKDYKDPLTGGRKRLSKTVDKATRQVQKQVELLLDQRFEKELELSQLSNENIRFSTLVDEFLVKRKDQVKPSTYRAQLLYYDKLLEIIGADTLVVNLTPQLIRKRFEDLLYKDGLTNNAVKFRLHILRMIMRHAVHAGYITDNPVPSGRQIEWRRDTATKDDTAQKFLDDDELAQVLTYLRTRSTEVADLCEWQYLTGMRFGEAAAMQVKNIHRDDDEYTAEVTGTLDYFGRDVKQIKKSNSPKTVSSFRSVTLPARAVEIYQQHKTSKKPSDYLFTEHGYPIHLWRVDHMLAYAKRKLGIDKKLTTHVFRHTHISKLAELGVPIYVIQARVGHADEKITKAVYLHVTKNAKKSMDEKLNLL